MSAAAPLAFRRIEVGGRPEWLTGRPRAGAPALLLLQPLFAEMNRCRMLVADMTTMLAAAGWSPWTLDLPGTGESETPLEVVTFADWRAATQQAAWEIDCIATIALRGGVLVEPATARRWRFAPVSGAALLRDLVRARLAGEAEPASDATALSAELATDIVELAGYRLGPALSQPLSRAAVEGDARTVTLASGPAGGDARVEGAALWRLPEPMRAPDLAAALTADIVTWLASC